MAALGERIKRIRTNSHLSVRELAAKVGVTASFIYQLEKGESTPSFSTLKKIAAGLGTSVGVLTDDRLPEDWLLVRRDRRRAIVTEQPGLTIEILAFTGSRDKRMQPHLFALEPGRTAELDIYQHERDDFLLLQEGCLEVSDGGAWYRLEPGDGIYLALHNLTHLRNEGSETARGIWIISPPMP